MANLIPTALTKYELTEQEELQGSILTELQRCKLQNLKADIAQNRLNLEFDVTNTLKFAQDEALLKGQLQIIDLLMYAHEEALIVLSNQQQFNQE